MSDQEKSLLIRKRASLKAKLTLFQKFLDEKIKIKEHLEEIEYINLEQRISKINSVLNEFDEIQSSIEYLEDDLELQMIEREKFESEYFQLLSEAKNLLFKNTKQNLNAENSEVQSVRSNLEILSLSQANSHFPVKLPVISLPKFNGEYEAWLEFRDTFKSLIHSNNAIGNIEKFHYLRASLQGGASEIINSLEFSSENYEVAWNVLCERFNNTRLLVHNHVTSLFALEPLKKESSTELRSLVDKITKNITSLSKLEQPVEYWDTLLVHIVAGKLDNVTSREWEQHKGSKLPTWDDFKSFLRNRADLLETLEHNRAQKANQRKGDPSRESFKQVRGLVSNNMIQCQNCKGEHSIINCEGFLKLTVSERCSRVKDLKLCHNCLKGGHYSKFCKSHSCKKCNKKHNVLLHLENDNSQNDIHSRIALTAENIDSYVLLSTAFVQIPDSAGNLHTVRAILDSGSQSSFISKELCERLNLKTEKINMAVSGLGENLTNLSDKCEVEIHSLHESFKANIVCLVLKEITGQVPSIKIEARKLKIPHYITLADPSFYKPNKIDILIGSDLFYNLLCVGQIKLGSDLPILHKTKLGWIVSGPVGNNVTNRISLCSLNAEVNIQQQLAKFWEIEECNATKPLSQVELDCELHFVTNFQRAEDGRFVVRLPLKEDLNCLGDSIQQAQKRFSYLEKRFAKSSTFKEQYTEFMREYISLGHMSLVPDLDLQNTVYFMPHHGVIRENSLTTKLRVVFDASAPTSTGVSLNELQMVGPTVQSDLLSLLLRFRKHKYVVSADVAKMYRQVVVDPRDRKLQMILWRESTSNVVEAYELNTVTYGHAAAPFLATRCILQLAKECENSLPDIAEIIRDDFYVDDLLSGSDTVEGASYICEMVSKVLRQGCFELRKWLSNEPTILRKFESSEEQLQILNFSENQNAKTLGLIWLIHADALTFHISPRKVDQYKITKRLILSHVAQIFDPLGLLSPCIIISKILLQRLWLAKLSWDEEVSEEISKIWKKFSAELFHLNELKIPRRVLCDDGLEMELHGFSDASEAAYGGSLYIRSVNKRGDVCVKLLCAKSKVAPLKTLTIPKLELCGALILAKIANKVLMSFKLDFSRCVFWTDSTIVLGWLRTPPNMLKIFVSNRVQEIQSLLGSYEWRHVSSKDNPSDLLSRGLYPSQIGNSRLWWDGPEWLSKEDTCWPTSSAKIESLPELRSKVTNLICIKNVIKIPINFERFSSFKKLTRVIAYVLRFCDNLKHNCVRRVGILTLMEIENAERMLVKYSQNESFNLEYTNFISKGCINSSSRILNLNPFMDKEGIIRVGGRLRHSQFSESKKHPILLCSKHIITRLILIAEHARLLHAGPQQLLASVREKYWPIHGRNIARAVVRNCIKCARFNPQSINPIMGDLPENRLRSGQIFDVVGVDYAGPLNIRCHKGRGSKTFKCYICLFICFTTKAIHIELVSDLTTESFILSLRRFVSRRGLPSHIYSDNGTCFIGAKNELNELGLFLTNNCDHLAQAYLKEKIQWHFIPANSPHFGGLWEAGVKSSKYHLKRVAGNAQLTFEEMNTLLVQIESILNSRPLYPLSNDPSDLLPLTPAHFLVGKPLTDIPDPDYRHIPENRLSVYQRIQQIKRHFWSRWSKEYVAELQIRVKWKQTQSQLHLGDLVLIKEDNQPPLKWRMGRIVEVFSGADNVNRVAVIKTATGIVKRAFSKICPLPVNEPAQ